MTSETIGSSRTTPWWYWVVAVVSLLWNAIGGADYTMSHVQGEAYMRQMGMGEAQIAYITAYPSWMHAVWAIGVWASVAGSLLLLLRMRWAFHAFALSTLGAAGALAYTGMVGEGAKVMGLVMPAVIVAICLVFVWFSWAMTKRGVLR